MADRVPVCVTFDHMGRAAEIGEGLATEPDSDEPGLRVGYPRLLGLLDELGMAASFFVEGWNGVHHRTAVAEIAARGHDVGLHGWLHEHWSELPPERVADLLTRGTEALRSSGADPVGFRAPGGDVGRHTLPVLPDHGFRYDASVIGDEGDRVSSPRRVSERLVHIPFRWVAVDSHHYLRRHPGDRSAPTRLEAAWQGLLDGASASGRPLVLVAHAVLSAVDDDRFAALSRVLRRVADDRSFEALTCAQLAARVADEPLDPAEPDPAPEDGDPIDGSAP